MRKYFLDNIRWMCILLLIPFHTCMIYNNFGENFYVKSDGVPLLTGFIQITYPWFMPILFVIAGMSSCYALTKRSPKEYINERKSKLLIPLISGILLLVPIQTFYAEKFHNGYSGGYFHQYILFFTKINDLTGYTGGLTPAHLWFILYLYVISLISLPIIIRYRKSNRKMPIDKLSLLKILPMFLIFLIMKLILDISGKSLGEYFALFMLGYLVLSEDRVQEKLEKNRWMLFIALIFLTVLNLVFQNVLKCSYGTIYDIFEGFLTWIGILAILGMGKHYLNFTNGITKYFTKASFPFYVFHQSFVVLVGYYALKNISSISIQVVVIIVASFLLTILAYEILKRISITRFLFGINK
ncbi:acyltransferase family protein [Clostridium sp. 'White wine YQ']|uniref:acyltransferase family protein n=1 Tax=Clostridium sp. 'White wine YQ' TaxID=3027474 RepID=UPI002366D69E|nr:acyltransferase family protein [Clostridium sp. 'White wine YQ']MDD7796328.1 acyltransferase family protein [Clostridium sp. 'White wine YQ']